MKAKRAHGKQPDCKQQSTDYLVVNRQKNHSAKCDAHPSQNRRRRDGKIFFNHTDSSFEIASIIPVLLLHVNTGFPV
jgi:uncharacterized protein YbaR (Trm112 family)